MSDDTKRASSGGVGFTGLLTLLFIGLKLGGVIAWSWWWVLSPLWIGLAVFAAIMLLIPTVFFAITLIGILIAILPG